MILKGTTKMDGEQRTYLMNTVCERDNEAEYSESSCSLDLSRDKTPLNTVFY